MREIEFQVLDWVTFMPIGYDRLDQNGWSTNGQGGIRRQYTGLKDVKGQKIYDGDIVVVKSKHDFKLWGDDERPHEVRWDGCCYSFADNKSLFHFCKDPYECEVVGNIYANPGILTPTE